MNHPHSPTPSAPEDRTGASGASASGGALSDTKQKIAQSARDTATKVKSAASDAATRVKDQATGMVQEKKENAAGRIEDYGSALHDSARALEEKDPNIAWLTHSAADRLQRAAEYVRNSDWAALRNDCESVARRHPAVFFGGMFVAGLLVGNLIKASQNKAEDDRFDEDQMGFGPESEWSTASAAQGAAAPSASSPGTAPIPEIPTSASTPGSAGI